MASPTPIFTVHTTGTAVYTPINNTNGTLTLTVGQPFTANISYDIQDPDNLNAAKNVGLMDSFGSLNYTPAGHDYGNGFSLTSSFNPEDPFLGVTIGGTPQVTSNTALYPRGVYGPFGDAWVEGDNPLQAGWVGQNFLLTIVINGPAMTVTPPGVNGGDVTDTAVVGVPFSRQFTVNNSVAPYDVTMTNFPPAGLHLSLTANGPQDGSQPYLLTVSSGNTFYLTGTPTQVPVDNPTNSGFVVYSQSVGTSANFNYHITVNPTASSNVVIDTTNFPASARQLNAKSWTVTASGAAGYNWTIGGTLPTNYDGSPISNAGSTTGNTLTFNLTAKDFGSYSIIITATDINNANNKDTKTLTLNISDNCKVVGGIPLPPGTVGTFYSQNITIDGGNHTGFSIDGITFLPTNPGLSLGQPNAQGVAILSGTPTVNGNFELDFSPHAAGGLGVSTAAALPYSIGASSSGGLTLSGGAFPTFAQGDALPFNIYYVEAAGMTTGSTLSFSYTVNGGKVLQTGLNWTQSGSRYYLNGTPTSADTITVTIAASTTAGQSATTQVTIQVVAAVTISGPSSNGPYSTGNAISVPYTVTGGDGGSWSWGILNNPSWLTIDQNGVLNGTAQGGTATYSNIGITASTVLTNGQTITGSKTISVSVTAVGVSIVPISPTSFCAHTAPSYFMFPPVFINGGTTHTFTIEKTSGPGTISFGGGMTSFTSGQVGIAIQFSATGSYVLTVRSVDDNSITQSVTVNVDSISRTVTVNPSSPQTITPTTPPITFVGNISGSACSNSAGVWTLNGAGSIDYPYGTAVVYTPPSSITSASTATLIYTPNEDSTKLVTTILNLTPTSGGGGGTPISITTSSPLANGVVGTTYTTFTFAATGGSGTGYFFIVLDPEHVPPGINVTTSGQFSGVPSSAGTFTFTLSVNDSANNTISKQFTITVTGPPAKKVLSIAPNSTTNINGGDPLVLTCQNFINDFTSTGNQAFLQKGSFSVSLTSGATFVNSTTVNVTCPASPDPTGGVYDIITKDNGVITNTVVGGFTYVSILPPVITNINPLAIAAGSPNTTITITGQNLQGGSGAKVDFLGTNSGSSVFGVVPSPSQNGNTATAVLPSGALLVPNTYTVRYTNPNGAAVLAASPSLDIKVLPSTLTISGTLPDATSLVAYPATNIHATGGTTPYTLWTIISGALPQGLSFAQTTVSGEVVGQITGTTTSAAVTSSFTVQVTDSAGIKATKAFTLNVVGGILKITSVQSEFGDARIGVAYTTPLKATGGIPPYTFSITSGALPTGLSISGSNIVGTPAQGNAVTQYNFGLHCVDSTPVTPQIADASFYIKLLPAIPTVTVTSVTPNSGPTAGGTQVTISGTNFAAGAVVTFGNISANSVTVQNATTISCITPPNSAGAITVTVTNTDTSSGFLNGAFTYTSLVAPVPTSIDKQDGPFAGARQIVISGSNFTGVTSVKFGLVNSVGNVFDATNISINTSSTPQTITCTTPAYTLTDQSTAVTVNVYITNSQGTGTLGNGYTYRPPPQITAVVPNTGSTAGGQAVYVIGKNFFQRNGVKPRVFIGGVEVDPALIQLVES